MTPRIINAFLFSLQTLLVVIKKMRLYYILTFDRLCKFKDFKIGYALVSYDKQKTAEVTRELRRGDAGRKSVWASKNIQRRNFSTSEQSDTESRHRTESRDTRRHGVLGHWLGGQAAPGWKVEKSLNVKDSPMSKASMIPERRDEDD